MSGPARVFVEENHDTPLASVVVSAPFGAASDPPGLDGFVHHTAELARRGAGARDRAALDASLDALGASLDVTVSRDAITFHAMCLARNLDAVARLLADVLARPRFDPAEHEQLLRESSYELDELRDDDSSLAQRYFNRHGVPGHPYARSALGTRESLRAIERDAARDAYRRFLARDRLVVGFAGAVDQTRAEAIAAELVADLEPGGAPEPPAWSSEPPRGRRTVLVDKPGRRQTQLLLGHVAPRYGDADYTALLPTVTAFGGMFSSRLMQEIRVKRGWSYGAGCRVLKGRLPSWLRLSLAPSADVTPDALALTLDLYGDLARAGITDDERAFAVSYLIGSLPFSRATARQRLRLSIRDHLYGLPADHERTLPDRLAALTDGDIRAAATRWLRPDDLTIVLVATADDMLPRLSGLDLGEVEVVPYDAY